MWTPEQFAADFKHRWEGGLSMDRHDRGNWVNGRLIGSKYGVTAAALANYRKVPITSITANMMAALTFEEAGKVAVSGYYRNTPIEDLPWGRIPAIMFDFAYNAGVGRAVRRLQETVNVEVDGKFGDQTKAAYGRELKNLGEEGFAKRYTDARIAYYESLDQPIYIKGWKNRARYFLKGHPEKWWERFGQ